MYLLSPLLVALVSLGSLTRRDVVEALEATLPLNADELENRFDVLWQRWDENGDGDLSLDELFRPRDGLLDYLKLAKGGGASSSAEDPFASLPPVPAGAQRAAATVTHAAPAVDLLSSPPTEPSPPPPHLRRRHHRLTRFQL